MTTSLELVQRQATRYILNNLSSDCKQRLTSLRLFLLMYFLELLDVLFFIKCLKFPEPSFPILDYVSFFNANTRSSSFSKQKHLSCSSSISQHFCFPWITHHWNTLPPIDISHFYIHQDSSQKILWVHFLNRFDSWLPCTFHVVCPCDKCSQLPGMYNYAPQSLMSL